MKYVPVCVCVVSISLILACSRKTDQPEPVHPAKPDSKQTFTEPVAPERGYHSTEKPATPLPEGFDVTVLDAETGLPVSDARVRYKWHINWIPYTLDAVNTGQGVYRICTNREFGIYYVGVMAEGYLPDQSVDGPEHPLPEIV